MATTIETDLKEILDRIDKRLGAIESDVTTIKIDIATLKADVTTVKEDVKDLRGSIHGSKALSLLKVTELNHYWTSLWFPAQSC